MNTLKSGRPRWGRQGVTLIEIMVALVIIAGLFTVAAISMDGLLTADLRKECHKISGRVRYVYNRAALDNQSYQMIIDLDENSYRVDRIDSSGPMSRDHFNGKALARSSERDEKRSGRLDNEDDSFLKLSPKRAELSNSLVIGTILPEGIEFLGVQTSHHEELQTEGIATINFFPSGQVEESLIHVGETLHEDEERTEDNSYTLIIHPLTGRTSMLSGLIESDDAFLRP